MTTPDISVPLVTGKANVPIDVYDAIELCAARTDDYPARLLAEAARAVADWWNDPPTMWAREQVHEAAPDLADLLYELLGGGPCHPPITLADVRPAEYVP